MNERLKQIDDAFTAWEAYGGLSQNERREQLLRIRTSYLRAYRDMREVIFGLSQQEIIEAYWETCQAGSYELHKILGAYMGGRFESIFIDTMIQGIREDHFSATLFLKRLTEHLQSDITPIVLEILETKSGSLLRTALSIVIRFKIREALESVQATPIPPTNKIVNPIRPR
jgi:hypothetical protein